MTWSTCSGSASPYLCEVLCFAPAWGLWPGVGLISAEWNKAQGTWSSDEFLGRTCWQLQYDVWHAIITLNNGHRSALMRSGVVPGSARFPDDDHVWRHHPSQTRRECPRPGGGRVSLSSLPHRTKKLKCSRGSKRWYQFLSLKDYYAPTSFTLRSRLLPPSGSGTLDHFRSL